MADPLNNHFEYPLISKINNRDKCINSLKIASNSNSQITKHQILTKTIMQAFFSINNHSNLTKKERKFPKPLPSFVIYFKMLNISQKI